MIQNCGGLCPDDAIAFHVCPVYRVYKCGKTMWSITKRNRKLQLKWIRHSPEQPWSFGGTTMSTTPSSMYKNCATFLCSSMDTITWCVILFTIVLSGYSKKYDHSNNTHKEYFAFNGNWTSFLVSHQQLCLDAGKWRRERLACWGSEDCWR